MTTLVTGGSGYTARALSKLLHEAERPFIVASRSGQVQNAYRAVTFDYLDPNTYENPFKADCNIDRVYIVPPPAQSHIMPHVIKFIDFAVSKGVKKFVLLSSTQIAPEDVAVGIAHNHIRSLRSVIDFVILRPTWFMQNLDTYWRTSIKEHDQILSATEDGRLPVVSTDDVAQAAFDILSTDEKYTNGELFVLGPELLTFDEVTKILSSVIGREITHKRLSVEEMASFYAQHGRDPAFARLLGEMERNVAQGSEEVLFTSCGRKFIGKYTLREYIQENKDLWIS